MAARNAAECGTRSERDFGPVDRCRGHQWRGSRAEWRTQNIATEGRNSPQIARLEPARFRDRSVPVAHKRPDRTCPGLPVHAARARFQRQGSHTVRYRQPRRTLR